MSAYRPVITGTRHMIAAGHHAAAHPRRPAYALGW